MASTPPSLPTMGALNGLNIQKARIVRKDRELVRDLKAAEAQLKMSNEKAHNALMVGDQIRKSIKDNIKDKLSMQIGIDSLREKVEEEQILLNIPGNPDLPERPKIDKSKFAVPTTVGILTSDTSTSGIDSTSLAGDSSSNTS